MMCSREDGESVWKTEMVTTMVTMVTKHVAISYYGVSLKRNLIISKICSDGI